MKNPPAKTIYPWLRANLGKRCLAPLTSTDARALEAAVQILELYACGHDPKAIEAFGIIVNFMQPHCQRFAYHAIAHVLDWSDRAPIWLAANLLPIEQPGICAAEPGGSI